MPAWASAPSNWPIACRKSGSSSSGGSSPRRVVAGSVAMRSVYAGLRVPTYPPLPVGTDAPGPGEAHPHPPPQPGIEERDGDPDEQPAADHEWKVVVRVGRPRPDVLVDDVDERSDGEDRDDYPPRRLPSAEVQEPHGPDVHDDVGDQHAEHADRPCVEESVRRRRPVDPQRDADDYGEEHDDGQGDHRCTRAA